jgi:hypothetical protein
MMTLHASLVPGGDVPGVEVYNAAWARQGRGLRIEVERGHIARHLESGTTYHSRAGSTAAVSGLLRKMRTQGVSRDERAMARAEARQAKVDLLLDKIVKLDIARIGHVRVNLSHSLKAGNCRAGSLAFISKYFPECDPGYGVTIAGIAARFRSIGFDSPNLDASDFALARQVAAACLQAIRAERKVAVTA